MSVSKVSASFLLICLIGCCYQITMLTMQYARYDVSSSVKFVTEEMIKLPATTLCIPLLMLVNWTDPLVRRQCTPIMGVNCSTMSEDMLIQAAKKPDWFSGVAMTRKMLDMYNATAVMNVTLPITSIISTVSRLDERQKPWRFVNQKVHESFEVTEYLFLTYKCFTLNWKPEWSVISHEAVVRGGANSIGFFSFLNYTRRFRHRTQGYFFAYSDNQFTRVRIGTVQFIAVGIDGVTMSSFKVFKSRLLTKPFVSRCFDYSSIGIESQAACTDDCMQKKSVQEFGNKWFGQRLDAADSGIRFMSQAAMTQNWDKILAIMNECKDLCSQQDCHQEKYVSSTRSSSPLFSSMTTHASLIPDSPTVVTESSAKMTLTEFLLLSASCFGFWFGVSVLHGLSLSQMLLANLLKIRTDRMVRRIMRRVRRSIKRDKSVKARATGPVLRMRRPETIASHHDYSSDRRQKIHCARHQSLTT